MEIINEIKEEIIYQLDNFNITEIQYLSTLINNCNGNIYFLGVGKSGNISKHCCDLLKSISINCHYLDCLNILHGDIGVVNQDDIIIMFSKSGNTEELIKLIPHLKNKNCKILGICCDDNSKFSIHCDITIKTPLLNEISGVINKIPTNSCMSHLIFSNILVSILKQGKTLEEYKSNHPSGNIGEKLITIKDILKIDNYPKLVMTDVLKLSNVLLEMTNYKIGCCFFVDEIDNLLGILTDGDVRRLLLKQPNLTSIEKSHLNTNYYFEKNINKFLFEIPMNNNYIPLIVENKLIGIFKY